MVLTALPSRHEIGTDTFDGPGYTWAVGRRTHITLSDRQHRFLLDESYRTGLSLAELVRRAVDTTYRPGARQKLRGFEISLGVWRKPDEALVGRRPPSRPGSRRI
jgi:hypothetical protein